MNIKKTFFILLAISLSYISYAQTILLAQDVNEDTIVKKFGPNLKHYNHIFIGYGMVLGSDSVGSEIDYGLSAELLIGSRYKFKISKFFSIGGDLTYHPTVFVLKQTADKKLPNNFLHDKERITFHNLGLGFYNRFNFGRRGNYIGNFVDIGAAFDLAISVVHFTRDKYDTANYNNGRTVKTNTTGLVYVESFYYNVFFRIGLNRYLLYATYRLSDLFKEEYNLYPELPRIVVGVQIGLHY